MYARWRWRLVAAALVGLIAAGCETPPKPSEFAAELEQERLRAVPQVGGVSSEAWHKAEVVTVAAAAKGALKEAGITLMRVSETAEGNWYLGRSLAGRQVVVEVRPVLPGNTVVKAAVQGEDTLARGLLESLMRDIGAKIQK